MNSKAIKTYIDTHQDRFLDELFELLKIPSISADSAYDSHTEEAGEFVKNSLLKAGADTAKLFKTEGHPIVYGEKIIDDSLPTVLVYGHYDVQPPDPLDLWETEPFEPVVKETEIHPDGAIFARGACDDKGQVFMHIKALEAMLETDNMPCNIKFMIEGEEESGSESLEPFLKEHKDLLKCDVILVSDTSIIANDVPSVTTGLRGLSYLEVEVTGPNIDLHSGVYGGAVGNPINILCKMVSELFDENNHITIPGFYDNVEQYSEEERAELNKAPFSLEKYKKDLDIDAVYGEEGYTTIERTSIRPTLDLNGIWGGYTGEGAKTVLPSKAFAKLSCRLVPNQDPDRITKLVSDHLNKIAPSAVKIEVRPHHGGQPVVLPTDSIEYEAAYKAMQEAFGKDPIPVRGGGSIPIVALFEENLEVKTVLMGFGLDSDAIHSPNEHYGLFNFYKGIETIPLFYKYYSQLKNEK